MSALKVFIPQPPDPEHMQVLHEHLDPVVEVAYGPEPPDPAEYQVLVAGRPEREHLAASPHLHTLIIPWAGLPDVTAERLGAFPHLRVNNLHHNAAMTAEMALALLFAAAKFVVPFDRAFRRHDWRKRYEPNPSLFLGGKTALVLGYGQIGQRVGAVLHTLGMRVLAVRRRPSKLLPPGVPGEVHGVARLDELLPEAHVLVAAAPLTPATQGLLGEAQLRALPRGAVLVNVGRAALIDQAALYHTLQDGHLGAAGLDVWYNYPDSLAARANTPPADYPFHELENVVLSPHRAGHVEETERVRMIHLAESLNAAARGDPIPNPVDLQAGY
jgi:phosphoglycerate dehydrogenase-like enzyme